MFPPGLYHAFIFTVLCPYCFEQRFPCSWNQNYLCGPSSEFICGILNSQSSIIHSRQLMKHGHCATSAKGNATQLYENVRLHRQETAITTQLTITKLEFVVEYPQGLWEKVFPDPSWVFFLRLIWGRWGDGKGRDVWKKCPAFLQDKRPVVCRDPWKGRFFVSAYLRRMNCKWVVFIPT